MRLDLTLEELHVIKSSIREKHTALLKGYNEMTIESAPRSVHKMLDLVDSIDTKVGKSIIKAYEELYS
jgi:hypothetical protein